MAEGGRATRYHLPDGHESRARGEQRGGTQGLAGLLGLHALHACWAPRHRAAPHAPPRSFWLQVLNALRAVGAQLGMAVRPYSVTPGAAFPSFVAAMAKTGVLVARHGPLLANAMFLPPGATVLELLPYNWEWHVRVAGAGEVAGVGQRVRSAPERRHAAAPACFRPLTPAALDATMRPLHHRRASPRSTSTSPARWAACTTLPGRPTAQTCAIGGEGAGGARRRPDAVAPCLTLSPPEQPHLLPPALAPPPCSGWCT